MQGSGKVVQPSDQERNAINESERVELARRIQLTADQERRMQSMQRGGRRLLMFSNALGVKPTNQGQQQTAALGNRG